MTKRGEKEVCNPWDADSGNKGIYIGEVSNSLHTLLTYSNIQPTDSLLDIIPKLNKIYYILNNRTTRKIIYLTLQTEFFYLGFITKVFRTSHQAVKKHIEKLLKYKIIKVIDKDSKLYKITIRWAKRKNPTFQSKNLVLYSLTTGAKDMLKTIESDLKKDFDSEELRLIKEYQSQIQNTYKKVLQLRKAEKNRIKKLKADPRNKFYGICPNCNETEMYTIYDELERAYISNFDEKKKMCSRCMLIKEN